MRVARLFSACCAMALLAAACSSGGGKGSAPATTMTAVPLPTVVAPGPLPEPVSPACRVALRGLAGFGGTLDPFAKGNPSGLAAEVFAHQVAVTLTRCKSQGEWLSAARIFDGPVDTEAYHRTVLGRFCSLEFTVPRVVPIDAPGCAARPPSSVVAHLGPCPKRLKYPDDAAVTLNAAIGREQLGERLVPIKASTVRICEYNTATQRLKETRLLSPQQSSTFAAVVDQLETYVPPIMQGACSPATIPPTYLLTFANDSEQVTVDDGVCGVLGNGVLRANATSKWLDELQRLTARTAPPNS